MNAIELHSQQLQFKPLRKPTARELAEMTALLRLLASFGCSAPGKECCLDKPGAKLRSNLCGECHAQQLLSEMELFPAKKKR